MRAAFRKSILVWICFAGFAALIFLVGKGVIPFKPWGIVIPIVALILALAYYWGEELWSRRFPHFWNHYDEGPLDDNL